jgi:hypothetical protein
MRFLESTCVTGTHEMRRAVVTAQLMRTTKMLNASANIWVPSCAPFHIPLLLSGYALFVIRFLMWVCGKEDITTSKRNRPTPRAVNKEEGSKKEHSSRQARKMWVGEPRPCAHSRTRHTLFQVLWYVPDLIPILLVCCHLVMLMDTECSCISPASPLSKLYVVDVSET